MTSWVQVILAWNWHTDSRMYKWIRKFVAGYGVQTEPEAHIFSIPTDIEGTIRTVDWSEDKFQEHTVKKLRIFFLSSALLG